MGDRHAIDVTLGCDEALELVEASFAAAVSAEAPLCWYDRRWTIKRRGRTLRARTQLPWPEAPQLLALRVDATALADGGARVEARSVWLPRHAVWLLAFGVASLLEAYGLRLLIAAAEMISRRREREAARTWALRLVIEPLVPHQRGGPRGPFRG